MADEPTHRIDFQFLGSRLRAHVVGINRTLEHRMAYWRAIGEQVQALQPRELLVVGDLRGEPLEPSQLQAFVQALVDGGLFDGIRIAYVETRHGDLARVEAVEIVAREHGFEARVFGNEVEAGVWLRYGSG